MLKKIIKKLKKKINQKEIYIVLGSKQVANHHSFVGSMLAQKT